METDRQHDYAPALKPDMSMKEQLWIVKTHKTACEKEGKSQTSPGESGQTLFVIWTTVTGALDAVKQEKAARYILCEVSPLNYTCAKTGTECATTLQGSEGISTKPQQSS